jgi:peptidyl-prolyl cis-trans isomerase A (cyclophilin A)
MTQTLIHSTMFLLGLVGGLKAQDSSDPALVEIRTELGSITAELYPDRAPATVANFLRYVDGGFFADGSFHRTVHMDNQPDDSVRIAVIQGDINRAMRAQGFGPIDLERTHVTGLEHVDGALSMARGGPDSATSSFFICVGDQPELDYEGRRNPDGQGFAAFGLVLQGMDVVRVINTSPAEGQSLSPAIKILDIRRIDP